MVFVIVLFGRWVDGSVNVGVVALDLELRLFLVLDALDSEVVEAGSDGSVGLAALVTGLFCIVSWGGEATVVGLLIGEEQRDAAGDGPGDRCERAGDTDLDAVISTSSS